MDKKNKDKLIDLAANVGLAMISPTVFLTKKGIELILDANDNNEEQNSLKRYAEWRKLINDLSDYRDSDRTALMFLPKNDAEQVWKSTFPCDLGIVCLDKSEDLPENISIHGSLKTGILYFLDPRDKNKYYPVEQIQHVLIKDHLLEMKYVFERLGATRIDISYCGEEDESITHSQNDSERVEGSYGIHSGSVAHNGSHNSTNCSKKYYQLEIHKDCAGKCIPIDFDGCYWISNDEAFRSEVQSIIDGLTTDVIFREVTKSYQSQMAFDLHKLEAAYSYMESLNISAECQWDSKSMHELTTATVWNVHVTIANDAKQANQNTKMFRKIFDRTERDLIIDLPMPEQICNKVLPQLTDSEKEYLEEYKYVLEDGEITPRERKALERCRQRLGLSAERVQELETSVLSMTQEEKEYLEEYKSQLEEGEIGDRERRSLERLRSKLGLSKEQALRLEKLV